MTTEQQIKALAELDGAKYFDAHNVNYPYKDGTGYYNTDVKPYLTSYDAIIPLIQKQNYTIQARIIRQFMSEVEWDVYGVSNRVIIAEVTKAAYLTTPAQLCEALLRATGKWIVFNKSNSTP